MVSVDQSDAQIPVSEISAEGDQVTLVVSQIGGRFAGTRVAPDRLRGSWTQGPASLPLELVHTDKPPTLNRPQEPKPPFPYDVEEVTVKGPPGVELACTLTRPRGAARPGAVALLSGSGPQDRDEQLLGHKPFAVLADALARKGVAALRCDDRGTGKSTGTFAGAVSFDFADDAEAMLRHLGQRADLDGERLGLVGHSEGGLVASMVAARAPSGAVRFVVLLAAPGVRGDLLLMQQEGRLMALAGASEAAQRDARALNQKIFALLSSEKDEAVLPGKLRALWDGRPASLKGKRDSAFTVQQAMLTSRWFRTYLRIDPKEYLAKVKCPVLALNGERDAQVLAGPNLEAIGAALAGKPEVTVRELVGLNHLFQTAKTGAPSEYGTIEETMAPAALEAVTAWVAARAAGTQDEILRRNEVLFRAIGARDLAALEGLLAPEFRFESPGVQGGDRRSFLEGIAATPGTIESISNDELRLRRDGDRARLCGRQRAVVVLEGKRIVDESRFCDRWERRGGRWMVTFAGPGDNNGPR